MGINKMDKNKLNSKRKKKEYWNILKNK